nr:hypothetical protein [Tanacetum cinerariifolium]
MYRPIYEPPSPSPQPNQVYYPLNRLNLVMDLENLFSTQEYYAGQSSGQGSAQGSGQGSGNDYYAGQGSGNDYYVGGNQDYSMGHSSTHGSAPIEDDSPIEEVEAPAKHSAQGGLDLNEDATGSDEEVREVRLMGLDQARKKKSSTSSRSEASSAPEEVLLTWLPINGRASR